MIHRYLCIQHNKGTCRCKLESLLHLHLHLLGHSYIHVELLHNIINSNFKFLKRLASHERNLLTPCQDVCLADLDE